MLTSPELLTETSPIKKKHPESSTTGPVGSRCSSKARKTRWETLLMVIVFCCASQLVHSAPGKGRVPPPEGKKEFGVWLVGKKMVLRNVDSNVLVLTQKQVSRVLNSRMYTRYPSKKKNWCLKKTKNFKRQRWFMSIIFGGYRQFSGRQWYSEEYYMFRLCCGYDLWTGNIHTTHVAGKLGTKERQKKFISILGRICNISGAALFSLSVEKFPPKRAGCKF